jgi:lysozyme
VRLIRSRGWCRLAVAVGVAVVAGCSSTPALAYPRGVDVSNWQGSVDWSAVARSGRQFEFSKATEGTGFTDRYYAGNRREASRNGLKAGAYDFARPANDPIAEADHFISVASPRRGDLLPVLDLEDTGGLSRSQLRSWVRRWLDRVQARLGVKPLIYTYPSFWES